MYTRAFPSRQRNKRRLTRASCPLPCAARMIEIVVATVEADPRLEIVLQVSNVRINNICCDEKESYDWPGHARSADCARPVWPTVLPGCSGRP